MKADLRIYLEDNNRLFGKGPYELLKAIEKYASIRQAAKSLHLSYQKAFDMIHNIQENAGYLLVTSTIGGAGGGKSTLTPRAKELIKIYERLQEELSDCAKKTIESVEKENYEQEINAWIQRRLVKKNFLISIIGGGGKTTLMHTLYSHFSKENKVLFTSTTKMGRPADVEVFYQEKDIKNSGALFCSEIGENKFQGIEKEELEKIKEQAHYDLIICEADGSRQRPLKKYEEHEPPIAKTSDLVVIIVGLDGFYKEKKNVVHRSHLLKQQEGIYLEEDFLEQMQSKELYKNIPESAEIMLILNKQRELTQSLDYQKIATEFFKEKRAKKMLVGDIQDQRVRIVFDREKS